MSRMTTKTGAAAALCVAIALAGCSTPAPPEIDGALSTELRSSVVQVATAASTGDYAGALALLDVLEADISTAAAADDISAPRLATLQASLERTRADLTALILASTPEPTADPVVVAPGADPTEPAPVSDDATGETATGGPVNGNGGNSGEGDKGKPDDKGADKDKDKGKKN